MTRRNWNRIQPTSLRHAMQLCKDFARERHNLSVERIAERMAQKDHWIIYKWIESGRMPAILIPAYETVCGINYVSRWLAVSSDHLLIKIPTGKKARPADIQIVQEEVNAAVGALIAFAAGKSTATETIESIQNALEQLAFHRENVKKHAQPELEFTE